MNPRKYSTNLNLIYKGALRDIAVKRREASTAGQSSTRQLVKVRGHLRHGLLGVILFVFLLPSSILFHHDYNRFYIYTGSVGFIEVNFSVATCVVKCKTSVLSCKIIRTGHFYRSIS